MRKEILLSGKTLVFFWPSFFTMNIGDDVVDEYGNLDFNKLSDHNLSVFFHEYIHFLQDITSFYGVNGSFTINELFKDSNRIIKENSNIKFPIKWADVNAKVGIGFILNYTISNLTPLAKNDVANVVVKEIKVDSQKLSFKEESMDIKLAKLNIEFFEVENFIYKKKKKEVVLSSSIIAESMAYLLQRLCTNIDYKSPEYPYCIAEMIAIGLCPTIFKNNMVMTVALCDASLMSPNPGLVFLEVLKNISENKVNIKKPEDIIDHALSLKGIDYNTGEEKNIIDFFLQTATFVRDILKKYIAVKGKNFEENISKCFDLGIDYRRTNPYFFVDIANQGYIRNKNATAFLNILKDFGSPFIFDSNGNYSKVPSRKFDNEFMTYFRAFREMTRFYFEGKNECELKSWCEKTEGLVDDRCICCPIERSSDDKLCPVGLVWRNWGMQGYRPM